MSTQQDLKEEVLITLFLIAVLFATLWAYEKAYKPLTQSDFGKVALLTCVRGKSPQVNCESRQSNRFSRGSSTKKFQLFDVSLEEYLAPESASSYSLSLITSAAEIDITHGFYTKDELNYRQLKGLITESKEASVSLRYRGGLSRWLLTWFFANLLLLGSLMGFMGALNAFTLPLKLFNQILNK